MQRLPNKLCRKIVRAPCNVFINHRRIDTKRTIGRLLYEQLADMGVRPFLDNMNMIPGDGLFDHINKAILGCKVGVAIFSPLYCDSNFRLHELALLRETRKRVIPIFYDVKPCQLRIKDNGTWSYEELQRFSLALEEANYTVGLTFDSSTGDWSELLRNVTDAIVVNLLELEKKQTH